MIDTGRLRGQENASFSPIRGSSPSRFGAASPNAGTKDHRADAWFRHRVDGPQWLVPSDFVILFQTLYLPTGFFIGKRLTSCKVVAS